MVCTSTTGYIAHHVQQLLEYLYPYDKRTELNSRLMSLRYVAWCTSIVQLLLLVLIMTIGEPGIYTADMGFRYVSDNFCTKKILSLLFMVSTVPTWTILACSVALESNKVTRNVLLWLMSIPLPTGIGIVVFSLCETPVLHYVFVNVFVGTIACIHITVAYTARHFKFMQCYSVIVVGTAICGTMFMFLALEETGMGARRDIAVIMEYISIVGFIILNGLSVDRIDEHIAQ